MTPANAKTGDILRRAGKLTAVLQVFSAVLLVVLIYLYVDMAQRQKSLRDGIRENAIWAIFQLNREAKELQTELRFAVALNDTSVATLKRVGQRFDIVYSRSDLLSKGRFQDFFVQNVEIERNSQQIKKSVAVLDPLLTGIDKVPNAATRLSEALGPSADLVEQANHLLLTGNTIVSDNRAQGRDDLARLQNTSGVYLVMLLASVGFLIFTLRRQLRAVRQAGLGFETMANDLATAYNSADAGNRAKSQFMATMGHEIRTPLNAILGTAELLQLSALPQDVKDSIHTIRSSGEALLEILNEILDYSKIEYGKLEVEMRPAHVGDLARNVIAIMQGRAREHDNMLVLDMPAELERPWVITDPTRLRQIVLNLTSNAIKFTKHGTVTLRLRETSGPNGTCFLRIEVQDTGIGIDEAGRKKLFKPFSQVDASISRRFGGTGLGLTISKEIANRLGGTLGVESEVGIGSTFWLELRVEPTEAPDVVAPSERPTGLAPLPRLKILVVEDNKVNQQIALRFLGRLGQDADLAADGAAGVAEAAARHYDLILMDMQMPVMDGIRAARTIRAGSGPNRRTPIVAMTANASDEDRQACMDAGMDGFEAKPISLNRLHAVLSGRTPQFLDATVTAPGDAAKPAGDGIDPARRAELVDALGEDIFAELVDSFLSDAGALLSEYAAAQAEGNAAEADKALHTLKGAAANVGFKMVAETAQALRTAPSDTRQSERLSALIAEYGAAKAA